MSWPFAENCKSGYYIADCTTLRHFERQSTSNHELLMTFQRIGYMPLEKVRILDFPLISF